MADQNDGADKSFEPTQKKLDDARRKGDVPRSPDLNATAMYLGLLIAGFAFGSQSLMSLSEAMASMVGRASDYSFRVFEGAGTPVLAPVISDAMLSLVPFAAIPLVFVLGSIIAQRSFVVAPEKILPKLNRISVIENFKNKFGSRGIFEFVKSTVKLIIFAWILFSYLQLRYNDIVLAMLSTAENATVRILQFSLEFLAIVFAVSAVVGAIDYVWQNFEHSKKQRMSHKEVRDEAKEAEGDPYLKQARRSKAEQVALNSMLASVPDADVVIVNPTHVAVALKWSRGKGTAPECVAKGVDEIALRIRAIAAESNVPIHSDPPTARALHATVEIDQEIPPEHYKAVAAAIRFSDSMRAKAKARMW